MVLIEVESRRWPDGMPSARRLRHDTLDVTDLSSIPPEKVEAIRKFLEMHMPRKTLSYIEEVAGPFRAALLENFEIQDVILAVGDFRA